MNENRAVFTIYNGKYVLMHVKNGKAEHIYTYNSLNELEIGTIINCRIDKQSPGIGSCFAAYSKGDLAFVSSQIKNETVLPLIYKKEAYGQKKAVFSEKLSICGEYVILTDGDDYVKASSKANEENRTDYINSFKKKVQKMLPFGIVLRTKVFEEEDGLEKALLEYNIIKDKLESIKQTSKHLCQYSILYRPLPVYFSDILWLVSEGIDEVVTDIPEIMDILRSDHDSLSGAVNLSDRVSLRFYEDELLSLCKLYSFDAKISEALSRKVYLKSGSYITFDHTEALWAIDVNSAKNDKTGDREDTFFEINEEAAREISRQLRIRNISGMIVIDFINMNKAESYDKLTALLKKELAYDRTKCRFIDFTGMHLAEIIRDRQGHTLYSILGN